MTLDLFAWTPPPRRAPGREWAKDNLVNPEEIDPARLGESPTPAEYTAAANPRPRDYAAQWLAFVEERPDIARWIAYEAVVQLVAGERRISVDDLVNRARRHFATKINNSLRAACATWLVLGDPRLDALIERRKRKVTR